MADGFRELDAHIRRLKALGTLPARAAPSVASALERDILANVAKGVDPDGKAWAATQAGHIPLQHTADELRVVAVGTAVIARLEGVHARHHHGAVRGKIARRILPISSLPAAMVTSITKALTAEFASTMRAE